MGEQMEDQLQVVEWAARECTWQQSGPMSVLWMLQGRNYAAWVKGKIEVEHVLVLATIVEPRENKHPSYRRPDERRSGDVAVGSDPKAAWETVPGLMADLLEQQRSLSPDEWFREYEEIHPFFDGNGRTGSIWWNWLRGSLDRPEEPPDFWNYRTPELFDQLVTGIERKPWV